MALAESSAVCSALDVLDTSLARYKELLPQVALIQGVVRTLVDTGAKRVVDAAYAPHLVSGRQTRSGLRLLLGMLAMQASCNLPPSCPISARLCPAQLAGFAAVSAAGLPQAEPNFCSAFLMLTKAGAHHPVQRACADCL